MELDDKGKERLKKFLEPIEKISKEYQGKLVKSRAKETLVDSRLKVWLAIPDPVDSDDEFEEEEWHGIGA